MLRSRAPGPPENRTRPGAKGGPERANSYHLPQRGEIRGGRFVGGFSGEQFALPEAVETLRAIRRNRKGGEMVLVAAADPLNLVGILTPGGRVSPLSGQAILYVDGVPVEIGERHVLKGRSRQGQMVSR
jgi:ATP-dependent Lhr-like helicase